LATSRFLRRDPAWTDSIAVGSESFVKDVAERTRNRVELDIALTTEGLWTVREQKNAYE
jgi:hypothetical protein